jgi:large subunit ribosomal protein L17
MRHLAKGRKFHRKRGDRKAFIKSLISNLAFYQKIETTEPRAKEIKKIMEKAVTLAKKQNLASLKLLIARFGEKAAFEIFHKIAPKCQKRSGGYLRIIRSPRLRKRDAAKMVIIEFVD